VAIDTERALRQREANASAKAKGAPLPFPNVWDMLDPTKVPSDATVEHVRASQREFEKVCHPRPRKRHVL
jgi:hypothetical protein